MRTQGNLDVQRRAEEKSLTTIEKTWPVVWEENEKISEEEVTSECYYISKCHGVKSASTGPP